MGRLIIAIAILISLTWLTGCVGEMRYEAARGALIERYRITGARLTEDSMRWLCRGATVGSIVDRFGYDEELMAAYEKLCSKTVTVPFYAPNYAADPNTAP